MQPNYPNSAAQPPAYPQGYPQQGYPQQQPYPPQSGVPYNGYPPQPGYATPQPQYPAYPPQPQPQVPSQPQPPKQEYIAPPSPEDYGRMIEERGQGGNTGPKWPKLYMLPYPGPKVPGMVPQLGYRFGGFLAEDGLVRQQREMVGGKWENKFWKNGDPAWETLLIIQTAENVGPSYTPEGQEIPDDGRRGISMKGQQERKLAEAVRNSGDSWPPKAGAQVYTWCTAYVKPGTTDKQYQWEVEYIPANVPQAPVTQDPQWTPPPVSPSQPATVTSGAAPAGGVIQQLEALRQAQAQARPEHHGNPEDIPY